MQLNSVLLPIFFCIPFIASAQIDSNKKKTPFVQQERSSKDSVKGNNNATAKQPQQKKQGKKPASPTCSPDRKKFNAGKGMRVSEGLDEI